MKAIMISDKPKWCALMMNGIKNIEVRKNKSLASAIQKLIDEYGYADIYVYCTKDNKNGLYFTNKYVCLNQKDCISSNKNGKVLFKFRCYKVEEINKIYGNYAIKENEKSSIHYECWLHKTCLLINELDTYLNGNIGYAIHISDLEIFGKPKELNEFRHICELKNCRAKDKACWYCGKHTRLTKAPQNMCYIETEN